MYSTDASGSNWNMYKENVKLNLFEPGGLGISFKMNIKMRWLRVIVKEQAGYECQTPPIHFRVVDFVLTRGP